MTLLSFLGDLLLPVTLGVLTLRQRQLCPAGYGSLAAESVFLLALCQLGGPAAFLLLLACVVLFSLDYRFYERMHWAPDHVVLRQAFREPREALDLFLHTFGRKGWIRLLVLSGLVLPGSMGPSLLSKPILFILLALCLGAMLLGPRWSQERPPLSNALGQLFFMAVKKPDRNLLFKPKRVRLPQTSTPAQDAPNILLIVCESLNRRILDSPEGRKATPRYHAFLQKEEARLTSFPFALCNSAASDISYPSLFTGVEAGGTSRRFHQNPTIWAAARARGWHSSFYSSQSLAWAGLETFLIDDSLDRAVYRETLKAPAYCGLAMDDRLLNPILIEDLTRIEKPFFSVVNYNMLHFPYRNDKKSCSASAIGSLSDYWAALEIFDLCFGNLLDALASSGKLANTTILFTSDHGETPARATPGLETVMPLRVSDYNSDILRIPFWIRPSPGALAPALETILRSNASATVSNLDLYPSILHLLGWPAEWRRHLASGQSLFDAVPSSRTVVALNTNELRQWTHKPMALAQDGWLLIFHHIGRSLELLRLDDATESNWWNIIPENERVSWAQLVSRHLPGHPPLPGKQRNCLAPEDTAIRDEYNGRAALGSQTPLHQLNNWSLFSLDEWETMCRNTARVVGIQNGDKVFEAGCGAGAFLEVLQKDFQIHVSGVDLAGNLVRIAQERLPGDFKEADIRNLSFIPPDSFDKVLSHGVFLYLPGRQAVEKAALELVRIAKPDGLVYIGVLNDPARLGSYQSPHPPSGNYSVTRNFWIELAARNRWQLKILDQDSIYSKPDGYDGHSRLRYSLLIRKI